MFVATFGDHKLQLSDTFINDIKRHYAKNPKAGIYTTPVKRDVAYRSGNKSQRQNHYTGYHAELYYPNVFHRVAIASPNFDNVFSHLRQPCIMPANSYFGKISRSHNRNRRLLGTKIHFFSSDFYIFWLAHKRKLRRMNANYN